ncbi:MAG: DUF4292 domain-containing protein [Deltaproteobacteria bacterium]|nr:DUF4292 domain-containing protein [Deltaproteobacteria bacterium]
MMSTPIPRRFNIPLALQPALFLIVLSLFINGCAAVKQRPGVVQGAPEAAALLDKLQRKNATLLSFKGSGRMHLSDEKGEQTARILWAASGNEKIRIELIGPAGRPSLSFSYDGERIYLISHAENRFYTKAQKNASLEKLTSIPVKVSTALDLLAGRLPKERYSVSTFGNEDRQGQRCLVLKRRDRGKGYDRVCVEVESDAISTFESFDADGRLEYRVECTAVRRISGFLIPEELSFCNGEAACMQITVKKVWPNAPVADRLFVLKKPK